MLALWGHKPLPCRMDPRWDAVRHERVDIKLSATPEDITWYVFGHVRYQSDLLGSDDWATPRETLKRGYGDCEDHALLKRAIWLANGGKHENGLFMLVRDQITRRDHAIFLVNDGDRGWVVMDSITPKILSISIIEHFTPRFAYSGDQTYVYGRPCDA